MEAHVDQAANATVENPVFIDVPIILRAIVLCLLILITIVGEFIILSSARTFTSRKKIIILSNILFLQNFVIRFNNYKINISEKNYLFAL